MAKTSGGVRSGSGSRRSSIQWEESPGGGYKSIQLRYIGNGNEYGVVGRNGSTYW